ncbi:hypothetical protein EDM53_03685 [Rickettsiales endosymbiont of Peranema trichophorum]|uniref:hypothetical protein n=1 Tax=Rickettsiales endosymbiont of Peranema trichophorum TaxID=2486577 RepID=UPI001022F608|nr:hypothetical protein [Rickettsiales endosymbiont of Peranema trichophorum]RZI46775.1 hypothetical protein EDM53_03685 [Rickettsiales endosymbiont of Peranema trichophorum]
MRDRNTKRYHLEDQRELHDVVMKYMKPLIELIKKAAEIGVWEGLDGAAQYLLGTRMEALKQYGKDYHNKALAICFESIVESTKAKQNWHVLKKFTETNIDFVLTMAEDNPSAFIDEEIRQYCLSAMNTRRQKQFLQLVEDQRITE